MRHVVVIAASLVALADASRLRHRARLLRSSGGDSEDDEAISNRSVASHYPFYHTTDDIRAELRRLEGSCEGFTLRTMDAGSPDRLIDVVTIRAPSSNPVNKNFFLFGEHARELISPESGLHLVRALCGEGDAALVQQAKQALADNEFQVVVNGNPGSRLRVERGDFCLRTNPNGVDLNRNWDEKWQPNSVLAPGDTNPGPRPFSEPETQIFKRLVEEYKPTTFLTVHSGTRGMYMPWAYDMEHLADRNQPEMMRILKALDKDHCECPYGAAGREVGYSCPGTCLDWVYDELKAQYAFAFEIYAAPEFNEALQSRWEEKMASSGAFLQIHSHLGHRHFRDLFEDHPSSFVQVRSKSQHREGLDMTPDRCFAIFNPATEAELKQVVENWSTAYLDMTRMIVANLRSKTRFVNTTV